MRRLIFYLLLGLGTLAALVASVVFFVIPAIDVEHYRVFIEQKAHALTGYEWRIDGALRLRMTTRLAVVVSDIRTADVLEGERVQALHVARADAEISLWPLLHGILRIERLHVQGLRVLLDATADDRQTRPSSLLSDAPASPKYLDVVLNELVFTDMRVRLERHERASCCELFFTNLAVYRDGGIFKLEGRGAFLRKSLSLRGRLDAVEGAAGLHSRYRLSFAVATQNLSVDANGVVDDLLNVNAVDLRLVGKGDNVAALASDFGWHVPAIGPYTIAGRLIGSRRQLGLQEIRVTAGVPDTVAVNASGAVTDLIHGRGTTLDVEARIARPQQLSVWLGPASDWIPAMYVAGRLVPNGAAIEVQGFKLSAGATSLAGHVRLNRARSPPSVVANIHAPTIDLSRLPPAKTARFAAALMRYLNSDAPLEFGWMRHADLRLQLDADVVRLPQARSLFRPSLHLRLRDARLTVAPIRVQLAPRTSAVSARLIAAAHSTGIGVSVDLAGASIRLADILTLVGSTALIDGATTQIDVRLESSGGSPRELIGRINGDAKLIVGSGRFVGNSVDFGASLLTRLLGWTRPKTQRHAELTCAAVHLPVRNGVIALDRQAALQTSHVIIVASGVADLRNAGIDLYIYTRATEGLGLEAGKLTNMLKLEGALTNPVLRVNPKGVVQSGLSIGAAVSTGGVSLLFETLAKQAAADRAPCATVLRSSASHKPAR